MSATNSPIQLNSDVLGYIEDDKYYAIHLNLGLSGRGDDYGEALEVLHDVIAAEEDYAKEYGKKITDTCKPADDKYWNMFWSAG